MFFHQNKTPHTHIYKSWKRHLFFSFGVKSGRNDKDFVTLLYSKNLGRSKKIMSWMDL